MDEDRGIIEKAISLHDHATVALERGELDAARDLASEALELFERESGPDHPDVANVLNCLARIHDAGAEYDAAEACSRRAVEIMRHVRTRVSIPDVERLYVQSLGVLGNIMRTLGSYDEAEHVLREALTCAERALMASSGCAAR